MTYNLERSTSERMFRGPIANSIFIIKGGNGSDTYGNGFGYLGYPFSVPFRFPSLRMETDRIRMKTDPDISDIHFSIFLPFPSLFII